jgi:hypothetical protein
MLSHVVTSVHRGILGSLALAAFLTPVVACDSGSPVSSTGPGTFQDSSGPPSAPSPAGSRYSLSGRVTTAAGVPIVNAVVEVDHGIVPSSEATSHCPGWGVYCWTATRTDANGQYALQFEAGSYRGGPSVGYVYSFADGYGTAIQWVPSGTPNPVLDLQLQPIRPLRPGDTTTVSVEPRSSLCSDLEDWWVLDHRCEVVYIEASRAGTIVVEGRDASGAAVQPFLFFATSGNYDDRWIRISRSSVSADVEPGLFLLFVGVPEGTPTTQFDVVTSFR